MSVSPWTGDPAANLLMAHTSGRAELHSLMLGGRRPDRIESRDVAGSNVDGEPFRYGWAAPCAVVWRRASTDTR
jgi:hypothetical protein